MHFSNFGYEYIHSEKVECFDNIMLIYDGGDIYWITCSNKVLERAHKYFTNSEIFLLGFSLKKKDKYNMYFITNISYKDVLEDIKDNGLKHKIDLKFSEREYNKYHSFKIFANTFDEAITQLTAHLSTLRVNLL